MSLTKEEIDEVCYTDEEWEEKLRQDRADEEEASKE